MQMWRMSESALAWPTGFRRPADHPVVIALVTGENKLVGRKTRQILFFGVSEMEIQKERQRGGREPLCITKARASKLKQPVTHYF